MSWLRCRFGCLVIPRRECCCEIPIPHRPIPPVVSVDDFALRRRNRYGTAVIDAVTHERIAVLADRKSDTLEAWLRDNPGVEVVGDGSATYAEAIRRARPDALQGQ